MDLDIGTIEGILTAGFFNQMCLMPKVCNFKIRLNFCNKKSLLGQKKYGNGIHPHQRMTCNFHTLLFVLPTDKSAVCLQ